MNKNNPHQLTREEMEHVIARGGSVLYKGAVISSVAHLPSLASLAKGDPEAEAVAGADLDQRINALLDERERLRRPPATEPEPAGATTPVPPAFRLDGLEAGTLPQLLVVAAEYGVENLDLIESRTQLIAAIRAKAGYRTEPPSDVSPAATIKTNEPPAQEAAVPPVAQFGPVPAGEGVTTRGIETAAETEKATEDGDDELRALTVDQLKKVAKEAGVENFAKINTTDDLIDAIKAKTA